VKNSPVAPASQVLPLEPEVARSPVAAGGFLLDSPAPLLQVPMASQRPAMVCSKVAVDDCPRDLLVNYSLVASPLLQAPAPAPAVARSQVVVRDCRRVHPAHCSPVERRVLSNRPELAYPEALA
jgi:hypothetical protein